MENNMEQTTVTDETITPEVTENIPEVPEEVADIEAETEEEEGKETETETNEGEFNPDEMEFDTTETTFGKYDLSKYKDNINFDNVEAIQAFNEEAAKLEALGFTQEQVDYMCENILDLQGEAQEEPKLTKKEVEANFKKHLSVGELRDYKTVNNYLKSTLKGTELEANIPDIMSNPFLYQYTHILYKQFSGGKIINKANVEQGQNIKYTVENAQTQYDNYLKTNPGSTREEKMNFLTNEYEKLGQNDKKKFEDIFDGLFIKK